MSNIITMYKGDTYTATIFINAGTHDYPARYILEGTDQLQVKIYNGSQYFKSAVISKTLTSANLNAFKDPIFSLTPNDTSTVAPGNYYMEIKLLSGSDVMTVLSGKKFVIL